MKHRHLRIAVVMVCSLAPIAFCAHAADATATTGQAEFAPRMAELELAFPIERQERRSLPDGSEFYVANGTVTNIGMTVQTVPPILIVLRDGQDRIVYKWTVNPPKHALSPGESETIAETVLNIPKSAKFADIGWKPQ